MDAQTQQSAVNDSSESNTDAKASENAQAQTSLNARMRRLTEYQDARLKKSAALADILGPMNNLLTHMANYVGEGLEDHMQNTAPSMDRIAEVQPVIDGFLRVVRQLERNAQFEFRVSQARKAKPKATKKGSSVLSRTDDGRSEDS